MTRMTTSPTPAADWVEWTGDENPAPGKQVEIQCRGGHTVSGRSDYLDWSRPVFLGNKENPTADIIAYRVVSPTPANSEAVARQFRHLKRGTIYTEIGEALLQQSSQFGPVEGDAITVYRGEDGHLWARASSEFHDGRFEEIDAQPHPSQQAGTEDVQERAYNLLKEGVEGFDSLSAAKKTDIHRVLCAALNTSEARG